MSVQIISESDFNFIADTRIYPICYSLYTMCMDIGIILSLNLWKFNPLKKGCFGKQEKISSKQIYHRMLIIHIANGQCPCFSSLHSAYLYLENPDLETCCKQCYENKVQCILGYSNPFGLELVRIMWIVRITEIIPNASINNTMTPFLAISTSMLVWRNK